MDHLASPLGLRKRSRPLYLVHIIGQTARETDGQTDRIPLSVSLVGMLTRDVKTEDVVSYKRDSVRLEVVSLGYNSLSLCFAIYGFIISSGKLVMLSPALVIYLV